MVSSQTYSLPGGIDIFFTDSGPPAGSVDYTTLVIIHGSAFTGDGFKKMHDHAHGNNLRTVILNRREYPGSTKFSDSELEDLKEGRKIFLDRLAIQLRDFLRMFIDKEDIPKISPDRKSGGFAIMAWSMGSATAMSLFSDPNLISPELYSDLVSYVKDLVLYHPPYLSFGYELPANQLYEPWTDPECNTPEELYQNFRVWITSYYDHPDVSGDIQGLDDRKRTGQTTITSWTQEEMGSFYYEPAAVRSELRMYVQPMQKTISDLAQRVLFNEQLTQNFFPRVPVTYISASRTSWHSMWAYIEVKRQYGALQSAGMKIRPTRFIEIPGGNHFAHWDMPAELIKATVEGIRG